VIIVMEPATGAILAMATLPTYSLTEESVFSPTRQAIYKPTAVTDTYEPGSVMKLVTVAAAVEEHVVTPATRYRDTGVAIIDGVPIRNWDGGAYGDVDVRGILVHSLNTGTQWIAAQLGAERFYNYVELFGFGKPTGVRLNGEAGGAFRRPSDAGWTRVDLATNSYGQSIAVTPLQMITAIAALGNGGVLMRPQLVREIRSADGVHSFPPESVRQVVSPSTADTMLDMMVSVWNQDALRPLRIDGYTIAAKSGTADIPEPGGYRSGQTYASFAGFGPVPNPRFAILVRLDRPEAIYGGVTAAPVFRAVANELFTYLRIPRSGS
jgi:cell division protein FtsI/penicillin-binding protein 2